MVGNTNWGLGTNKYRLRDGAGASIYKLGPGLPKRYYFNGALKDQLFKKTITCNKTLHVKFFVRAGPFAYVPACAHVPLFFTRQSKDAQKIGHTSEVLNAWAYNDIGHTIYVDLCKTILFQDIFDFFLSCLSVDFMKAVKAFSTSFFGTLSAVLKH